MHQTQPLRQIRWRVSWPLLHIQPGQQRWLRTLAPPGQAPPGQRLLQVAGSKPCQRQQLLGQAGIEGAQRLVHLHQTLLLGLGKHRLQGLTVIGVTQRRQPLITPRQHVDQQVDHTLAVAIQMRQQRGGILGHGSLVSILGLQHGQRGAGRFTIQLAGILDRLGLRAKARQHRHLPRQRSTQRIDGLQPQPGNIRFDLPVTFGIALQYRPRQIPGQCFVPHIGRTGCRACLVQGLQHPPPHLTRRLAGEGHGDDFLRFIHLRQQHQQSLYQQLGLARTSRGLHDERA